MTYATFSFSTESLKYGILHSKHIGFGVPHFKCSTATGSSWLLNWTSLDCMSFEGRNHLEELKDTLDVSAGGNLRTNECDSFMLQVLKGP